MAHELDFSRGVAAIARAAGSEVPWHGFGFEVNPEANIEEWARVASLDWTYEKAPVQFQTQQGKKGEVPNKFAIYRSDTGAGLSVVSGIYKPVNPLQVLDFYRSLIELGEYKMETCGALRGGRKIWALARSQHEHEVGKSKDLLRGYLLLSTSCDYSSPTLVAFTSIRVVCANTLQWSHQEIEAMPDESDGKRQKVTVRHHQTFNPNEVKKQMGLMGESWEEFIQEVDEMAKTKLSDQDALKFFSDALDVELDEVVVSPRSKRDEQQIVDRRLKNLFNLYQDSPGVVLGSSAGTLWGALNAVTYWTDHERQSRGQEIRFDRALFGIGAKIKARALSVARGML